MAVRKGPGHERVRGHRVAAGGRPRIRERQRRQLPLDLTRRWSAAASKGDLRGRPRRHRAGVLGSDCRGHGRRRAAAGAPGRASGCDGRRCGHTARALRPRFHPETNPDRGGACQGHAADRSYPEYPPRLRPAHRRRHRKQPAAGRQSRHQPEQVRCGRHCFPATVAAEVRHGRGRHLVRTNRGQSGGQSANQPSCRRRGHRLTTARH